MAGLASYTIIPLKVPDHPAVCPTKDTMRTTAIREEDLPRKCRPRVILISGETSISIGNKRRHSDPNRTKGKESDLRGRNRQI